MIARNRSDGTFSMTILEDALEVVVVADDLRRSLAGVADLLDGAIAL